MTRSLRSAAAVLVGCVVAASPVPVGARTLASSRSAGGPGAEAASRRATVRVDTRAVEDGASVIERRILERSSIVLRSAQVLPAESPTDPILMVRVQESKGDDPGYTFTIEIRVADVVQGEPLDVECRLCTEGELVERVEDALASLLDELPESKADATTRREPEDEPKTRPPAEPSPSDSVDERPPPPERPSTLGGKGKAGVALLVLGAASVATGAGLAAVPPSTRADMPLEKTTTHPPGYVLLGIGGASLIAGGVLLALDRKAARSRSIALVPSGAGAMLVGRF